MTEQIQAGAFTALIDWTKPRYARVTLVTADDAVLGCQMKIPTRIEYFETHYLVLDAPVRFTGPKQSVNEYDADYRRDQALVNEERQRLHLAEAIQDGGDITLDGDTIQKKAEALKDFPAPYFDGLWEAYDYLRKGARSWQDTSDGDIFRRFLSATSLGGPAALQHVLAAMDRALGDVEAGTVTRGEGSSRLPDDADGQAGA